MNIKVGCCGFTVARWKYYGQFNVVELQQTFYRDGKKIIPENIEQFLSNPLTMAVWFMDDGNAKREKGKMRGYHLNTQSFTVAENIVLKRVLDKIWNIQASLETNHGYKRLFMGVKNVSKFNEIVCPHILPSLSYKISSIGDSSSPVETGILQSVGRR